MHVWYNPFFFKYNFCKGKLLFYFVSYFPFYLHTLWVAYNDVKIESLRQNLVICHQRKKLFEWIFIYLFESLNWNLMEKWVLASIWLAIKCHVVYCLKIIWGLNEKLNKLNHKVTNWRWFKLVESVITT